MRIMLKRLLERWLGLPPDKVGRLAHFVFLSISLATANVLAITLAESLFLNKAGSEWLPLFYVLLAVISVPVAAGFSQLVDRFRRPMVFRSLLVVTIGVVLGLRALLTLGVRPSYFAVYISFSLSELLIDLLFWVLIADYFTSLELKRYATFLVASMALGGLVGGGLAKLLSRGLTAENQLLVLPFLFGLAIGQVVYLDRSQKELGASEPDEEAKSGLLESLKSFPPLIRKYRIILLLALQALLVAALQRVTEYQVFSIYEERYQDEQALTGFLGTLNAALNVLEMLITFFLTRPLIQRLGVSRMNLFYPVTTMACFGGLAASPKLPAAIAGNINYDTLVNGLVQPLEALNCNAVPRRFLGRLRVLNDGLVFPAGMGLAGGLLWMAEKVELTSLKISLAGLGLSLVLLAVGFSLGKNYLQSLVEMLRSRAVNLDDVSQGLTRLPAQYAEEVRRLLASDDRAAQRLGVELASRADPTVFLAELEPLLTKADASLRRSLVKLYAAVHQQDPAKRVRAMLGAEDAAVRGIALEAMIASRERLSHEELRSLLWDANPVIRALACVAAQQAGSLDPAVQAACAEILRSKLDSTTREVVVRAIGSAEDRQLVPLLQAMLEGADASLKREALEILAKFAAPGDAQLEELAATELGDPEAAVRAAALRIVGLVRSEGGLERAAAALEDADKGVREAAVVALAAYGELALPRAGELLQSPQPELVDAAIAVLGRIGTRRAEEELFEFMASEYRQVARNLNWLGRIPSSETRWRALRTGIEDSNQRVIRRVLHLLSSLGHERILNCVRRIRFSPDERVRADAVEALASLSHRRFVEPILPLLEREAERNPGRAASATPESRDGQRLLQEVLQSSDRWIRTGALAVLYAEQGPLSADALKENPDPIVRAALFHTLLAKSQAVMAGDPGGSPARAPGRVPGAVEADLSEEGFFMSRVFFLRGIPLFQYLSLDDLLIIDDALTQKEFLAGETIFAEGSLGVEFCIVYRGSVLIQKKLVETQQELARLGPGECFGEMALFDDAPRSATAIASTDCTLLTLERSRFSSLLAQRPEMAWEVCRVLSLRLREANARLGTQAQATH